MFIVLTLFAIITTSSFVSSYDIRCFRPNHDHDVVSLLHPEDCRKFYKCDQSFNAIEQSCPPLLEFDPVLKICDWPKGYCTENFKPVENSMNCNGQLENSYQVDYENDCRTFFYCKNGVTRIGRCIPETRFDIMSQMCIDENLVDCYLPTDIFKRGNKFKKCGPLSVGETIPDEFSKGIWYYVCTETGFLERKICENGTEYYMGACRRPLYTTLTPTRTTTDGRPYKQLDISRKSIDPGDPAIQMFPNYAESCQTYFICQNDKCHERKCNFGKIFDSILNECVSHAYCHEGHTTITLQGRAVPSYIDCTVKQGRWYPDIDDCTKFYICANGTAYRQQCLTGQYFDKTRGICKYGSTETCKPDPNPECKCSCGKYKDGDKIPDMFYQNKYYICENGTLRSRSCDKGYVFDENKMACISENGSTTSEVTTPETTTPNPKTCGPLAIGDTIPDYFSLGNYYYICVEGGVLKRRMCENGYEYYEGACRPPIITSPPGSCGPLYEGEYLPDEFDDTKFYVCNNGTLEQKSCPNGQIFDKILLLCTNSIVTTPSTTTTTTSAPEQSCGNTPPGGRLPDPFDNTKFYVCVNGTLKHYTCPDNHYFDPNILQCVSTIPTTTPVIKNCGSTPDGGKLPDLFDNKKYYVCVSGVLQHRNCPSGAIFDANLLQCVSNTTTTTTPTKNCGPIPEGGLVPDFNDNTKFFVCVQGKLQHEQCPPDFIFDADRLQCVTNKLTTTVAPKNCGPTPDGGLIPDFYDKSKFYVCTNGYLLHRLCPNGATFDPSTMRCTGGEPTTTPETKNCGPTPDGVFLPDKFDKTKFYVCVQGILKHLSCPKGSEFDAEKLQCFEIGATTTGSPKNCGSVPNGGFVADELDNTKFYVCVNGNLEHKNCPNNTYFDKVNLVCTSNEPSTTIENKSCGDVEQGGFLPDEFDDKKFYVCVDGELRHMSCPNGTTFDKSQLICKAIETTTTTTVSPGSKNCGPVQNGGFIPDEFNEKKFYVCHDGVLRHLSCPVDTVFDKSKLICVETGITATTPATTVGTTTSTTSTTTSTTSSSTTSSPPILTTPQSGCGTGDGFIPYGDSLPDIFNEKAFFVCLPPGVLIPINCPENLVFSADKKACVEPSVTSPPTTEPPPVTEPPPAGACGNLANGTILPDVFNNNRFYVCYNGILFQKSCDNNWIFDKELLSCVLQPTTSSSTSTSATSTTTTTKSTTRPSTTTSTTTTSSYSCGPTPDGGRIPDKFDNTKFYVCVRGSLWHMSCPVDQIFDEATLMCMKSTTTTTINSKSCGPVAEGGFIPDKFNENGFYVCFNGTLLHRKCPPGNIFDSELLVCRQEITTTTASSTTIGSSTDSVSTTGSTSGETSTTTDSPLKGCGPLKEGEMLPDEFNINKYYVCVNGYLNQHTCPTGLIFDKVNLYCYNCSVDPTSTTTESSGNCGPLATGDLIPDEFNRQKFYICVDGYLKHLECANGHLFDPESLTCTIVESTTTILTTTTEDGSTTTDGGSTASKGCGNLSPGDIIPDEFNKYMFYVCNGDYLQHVKCPGDLVFDPSTLSCKLEELTTPTTTTSTSTTPTTTTSTSTTASTSTTTGGSKDFCPGGIANGTLIPNKNDCTAFKLCLNGEIIDVSCPNGFYFDSIKLQCAVNNGQCIPPIVTPPLSCGFINNGEFLPDAFDSTKFFVCFNGQLIAKSCQKGQSFDVASSSCLNKQMTEQPILSTQPIEQSCGNLKAGEFLPDFGNSKYFFVCSSGLLERRACPVDQTFDKNLLLCIGTTKPTVAAVVEPSKENSDCGMIKNGEFLANIHDEAKYYICHNGILTPQACPMGLIFKVDSGLCILRQLSDNNDNIKVTSIPGKRTCKEMDSGAYVKHETDNTKYYVCVLNMLQEEQCPPGHIFDSNELYCRYVWN